MAWSDLKAAVAAIIKTNGNQEITGALHQQVINSIIDNVGANATFKGIATEATAPGVPDGILFYLSTQPGTYSNFNGYVSYGGLTLHHWNGAAWTNTKLDSDNEKIQFYKTYNSNWNYKGRAKSGMGTPSDILNDIYIPTGNGTIFGKTVSDYKTQVLVGTGSTGYSVETLMQFSKSSLSKAFICDPNGDTDRYKLMYQHIGHGNKTFLINYKPDSNYNTKSGSKHAVLFRIANGSDYVRVRADGTTSELILNVGAASANTGILLLHIDRADLALQITSNTVTLFVNGEQKAQLSHSYSWLYDGANAYININKDIAYDDSLGYFVYGEISSLKLESEITTLGDSMLDKSTKKDDLFISTPFTVKADGGTDRYKVETAYLRNGDKTFFLNLQVDELYKLKSGSKHAHILRLLNGSDQVTVKVDGTFNYIVLTVGGTTVATNVYITDVNELKLSLQVVSDTVTLFLNGEQKAQLPHSYSWLHQNDSKVTIYINKDQASSDTLGYFILGKYSSLKLSYGIEDEDNSMSENPILQGEFFSYPIKSNPDGGTSRYLVFKRKMESGDKTLFLSVIPDENNRAKSNFHSVLLYLINGAENIRIRVDGTTSQLTLSVGGNTETTDVVLNDFTRTDLALQITSDTVTLFINGEQKAQLAHSYSWLYDGTRVQFYINKDSSYDDSLGYFTYGMLSSLKIRSGLFVNDYSMLEGYPKQEVNPEVLFPYSRLEIEADGTKEMSSGGIITTVNNNGSNLFHGKGTINVVGKNSETKEIFAIVKSSNSNLPEVQIVNCGSAITIEQSNGRTIDNEWVHPDLAYCTETGIGGYKYWMVASTYPAANNTLEDEDVFVSNDAINWTRVQPHGTTDPINLPEQGFVTSGARMNQLLPIPRSGSFEMNGTTVTPISWLKHDPAIMYHNGYLYIYLFYNFTIDPTWLEKDGVGQEKRFVVLIRTNDGANWECVRADGSTFAITAASSQLIFTQTGGVDNYIRFIDRAESSPGVRTEDRGYSIVKVSDAEYYAYLDNSQYGTSGVSRYKGTNPYTFDWNSREIIQFGSRITEWHISVRYYSGVFYLVANGELYTSADGITFTKTTSKIWRGGVYDRKYKATFDINSSGEVKYSCGLLNGSIPMYYPSNAVDSQLIESRWRSRLIMQQFASLLDMESNIVGGYSDYYIDIYNRSTGKSFLVESHGVISPDGSYKKLLGTIELEPGSYDVFVWGNIQINDANSFGVGNVEIK